MGSAQKIPISVIIVTKNEAVRLARALEPLSAFEDIWVVDSSSTDETSGIAHAHGARVVNFEWNGHYPKKRQWALDHLDLKYDRVLFVDADEILTPALIQEIAALDWRAAGYFISARYSFAGKVLRYGLKNKKLCLLDRHKIHFPVVDDLNLPGMGEIEGHYQPVLKPGYEGLEIGTLAGFMIHEAYVDLQHWRARHERYADWEAAMLRASAYPIDPCARREKAKQLFRKLRLLRPLVAFVQSYIWAGGFIDGRSGYEFARTRAHYYQMINQRLARKAQ